MANVLDEIKKIISKHSAISVNDLKPETRLDELDIESLDLVEIIFEIEELFEISVPYSANAQSRLEFTTIGEIVEGVRSILAKSTPS